MLTSDSERIEPIFVSVADAARILALSKWSVYQLCDADEIESQYHGKRRLVVLASVREYAKSLPRESA